MAVHNDPQIMELAKTHPELMKLIEQHEKLDKLVAALDKRHVRTPEETLERKKLSKMKLANRDHISEMVAKLKKQQ